MINKKRLLIAGVMLSSALIHAKGGDDRQPRPTPSEKSSTEKPVDFDALFRAHNLYMEAQKEREERRRHFATEEQQLPRPKYVDSILKLVPLCVATASIIRASDDTTTPRVEAFNAAINAFCEDMHTRLAGRGLLEHGLSALTIIRSLTSHEYLEATAVHAAFLKVLNLYIHHPATTESGREHILRNLSEIYASTSGLES